MIRSDREISGIMRKVHSNGTTPEVLFRKVLWAEGLRYKICPMDLPGKPDVVLSSKKLAIFIDGDYWHGNQWRKRGLGSLEAQFTQTKTKNKNYWLDKIRRNMDRDCAGTSSLLSEGWVVLRFWESEIQRNLKRCVEMTLKVLNNGLKPTLFTHHS